MIIILCNIPINTCHDEIIDLFAPVIKGGLFSATGDIKSVNLVAMKDKRTNALEYHGFVTLEPDNAALRAIKRLNGKQFKGMPLTVREYRERLWQNDRRTPPLPGQTKFVGNRKTPTRRRNLEIMGTPLFFRRPH
jgi:hypothetical protein